jgi:hypothetical protein
MGKICHQLINIYQLLHPMHFHILLNVINFVILYILVESKINMMAQNKIIRAMHNRYGVLIC